MEKYGFNFQWMYVWEEGKKPQPPDKRALDFLAEMGFNFVRIPTDYRFWTKNFDYFHPDEQVFEYIDSYLHECQSRNIHMCLNLHRAPGYCINRNDIERDNLWQDKIAQDGFVFQWELFAKRYKGISSKYLSFDLVNEPPNIGQYGMTRENHAAIITRTVNAIRQIDPDREIVIDGLGGGNIAMPELADLGVIHSGRGYQPMALTHYQAMWWDGYKGLPEPTYPDLVWGGKVWNKETLRDYYKPWLELQQRGVKVHIGEFGCFNKTPNDVALRWFKDLLSLYKEFKWGYSLWNFEGPFGIVEHGRPGAKYEHYHGFNVDRELLDLLLENMCR
ncbi:Aryl-phospho-beta-D-glucosidase BglC, GH1 family [Caldanaerobius fijiensis DSM 17918]|uniref:Aryl-phospho-beta-D-glucosidase BglC, GH1 family n=1 Tax=Caldanaerobius fijiensis DSM 17918 TaxID=1121256 RepID=A0A1M5E2M3_9THEO|nr:cellulase family glycosylhydrolase [Caldanaerobius fijiensis]SHF73518.1 Aryl-phospho-beta-D-glucosidase BglC, GH1 family [Caldanaerobius fijiensis DSM 17918]